MNRTLAERVVAVGNPVVTAAYFKYPCLQCAADCRELRFLLTSVDPEVCQTAAWFIGQIADGRSVPALLMALRTKADPHLRAVYVDALGFIRGKRATDALVRLRLEQIAMDDTAVIHEPDLPFVWGTVSTAAAEAAIRIKEKYGLMLSDEQERYVREKRFQISDVDRNVACRLP